MDFLKTRLNKPIIHSDFIERERITSALNRNKSKTLTLIIAGAGYGKSITVSQWLDQLDKKYCWVEMDEDCNKFKTFVEYIIEATRTVFPNLLGEISKMIKSIEVDSPKVISKHLINELLDIEEDFYIVIDDYHLIQNAENHQLVEMILKYLSARIHLIIISRNDPPLNINQLSAYDNVFELRGQDLRFTPEEIGQLSEQLYDKKLNVDQIKSVIQATEGWIIAARLHLKILSEGTDLRESSELLQSKQECLMENMFHEVITVEQDDIFKGLLLASFSKRFTIDLIVRLMEFDRTNHSFDPDLFTKRFRKTLKNTMFIYALDHEGKWFRFHRLVYDLMRNKVKQRYSRAQIKNFHIEASRYLEGIHSYEEAIHTALYADDVDFAISIIIANYNTLLDSEQFQRLGSWLNMLPPGTVEMHPELLMTRAILNEAKHDLHGLTSDLEIFEKIMMPVNKNSLECKRMRSSYYAMSAGKFFYSKEYDRTLKMTDKALPLLNGNYSYVYSFVYIIRSMTLQITGYEKEATELTDKYLTAIPKDDKMGILRSHLCNIIVKSIQGKIDKISVSANLIIKLSLEQKKWMTYAMANYYLAASSYYRNELEKVRKIYEESRKNGFSGRPNFILQTGFFAALQMHSDQDNEGYDQIISELYDYVNKFNKSELTQLVAAFELEHELLHGNLNKARELATHVDFRDLSTIFYFYTPSLTKIKLMLADPENWDIEETRLELEELIENKEKKNLEHILVQVYPLIAIWHSRYGRKTDAISHLRKAIKMAEKGGFVRVFLDLGEEMRLLLTQLELQEKKSPFIDKLLNGFNLNYRNEAFATNLIPMKNELSAGQSIVTPRETEILNLIGKGHSNKEIADLLFLSHSTIKTYLYNCYQKLEVKNRVEAIMKSKKLGILSNYADRVRPKTNP
ncbi:LuxR C-terminal-related transcriptional regulator [Lutimonas vermicola]|uniref:LuxR C-terminal-related transcriptional regulator n=1 Tax=Lutimonas vermicola TaxID=414288 RepID=A0ABU9KZY8_9FLAO